MTKWGGGEILSDKKKAIADHEHAEIIFIMAGGKDIQKKLAKTINKRWKGQMVLDEPEGRIHSEGLKNVEKNPMARECDQCKPEA